MTSRATSELRTFLLQNCDGLRAVAGSLAAAAPIAAAPAAGAAESAGGTVVGRIVMVVSPNSGDGRTISTACLGWALATVGDTVMVDAHLRKPELGTFFCAPDGAGLLNVLRDGLDFERAVHSTGTERLMILPSGRNETHGASGSSYLLSDNFARLINDLRHQWKYILIDTPPLLTDADALLMTQHADDIILVLMANRTSWAVARDAAERLERAGGRLKGVVLNRQRSLVRRPRL